jgi:DNA-binding transcriptional MerR regulator
VRIDVTTTLTIDDLASAAGTTTRTIRSFQTMGLLNPPALRGRTGLYDGAHLEHLRAILRLQGEGFSLASLAVLFDAHRRGDSLSDVLGLPDHVVTTDRAPTQDPTELYGFADLLNVRRGRRPLGIRPLLSVVPTTVWDETEAS